MVLSSLGLKVGLRPARSTSEAAEKRDFPSVCAGEEGARRSQLLPRNEEVGKEQDSSGRAERGGEARQVNSAAASSGGCGSLTGQGNTEKFGFKTETLATVQAIFFHPIPSPDS